jgi:hypothetical protein
VGRAEAALERPVPGAVLPEHLRPASPQVVGNVGADVLGHPDELRHQPVAVCALLEEVGHTAPHTFARLALDQLSPRRPPRAGIDGCFGHPGGAHRRPDPGGLHSPQDGIESEQPVALDAPEEGGSS